MEKTGQKDYIMQDSCSGGGAEAKWRGRHRAAGLNFCDIAVGVQNRLWCDVPQTDRVRAALQRAMVDRSSSYGLVGSVGQDPIFIGTVVDKRSMFDLPT